MLITALEPRRKALTAVYIDGEYAMKLDTATLLENRIKIGTELTDEELLQLIKSSDERRAKEKALYLIAHRDHSKKELRDKIRRTCSKEAAEAASEKMEELGLVNDELYAERYAKELMKRKHMAPRAIRYKLKEKGIASEIIDEVIEELEFDPQSEIKTIVEKKYPNYDDPKVYRRAAAYLQRMGYSFSDIKSALNTDDYY